MSRRKKQNSADPGPDPNAWMVTFADLVMLLLTFFVLLLTMSSMDSKRLKSLFTHFRGSTGVLELSGAGDISGLGNFITRYYNTETMLVIDQQLLQKLFLYSPDRKEDTKEALEEIQKIVGISDDSRGIVISFEDDVFFDPGKVTIKKEVYPFLNEIAGAIRACANEILIMGHTDGIPVRNPSYESNWVLSLHRGLAVLDYLIGEKGLPPERFLVGGYGPSRPLYSNDTPKQRARNRRVEIIFKHLGEV